MKNFDDTRRWLKSRGWRRRDRATGANRSDEIWINPIPKGSFHTSHTYEAALRIEKKREQQEQQNND